jgi:hypothetical protein
MPVSCSRCCQGLVSKHHCCRAAPICLPTSSRAHTLAWRCAALSPVCSCVCLPYLPCLSLCPTALPAASEAYQCILLDPPWENKSAQRSAHYPTLPSRHLLGLPLRRLMHPVRHCHYECACGLAGLLLVLLAVCGRLPPHLPALSRRCLHLTDAAERVPGWHVGNKS